VTILIDGRSGSGKTELARLVVAHVPGAQLVRLDDLYPGWDGLDVASAAVPHIIATHRWQEWDWTRNEPSEWHYLDPARELVIEGVGALSRASRPLAGIALWVELDDAVRKRRALARDGEAYAPNWERWAAQERRFIARENPRSLADVVVSGR